MAQHLRENSYLDFDLAPEPTDAPEVEAPASHFADEPVAVGGTRFAAPSHFADDVEIEVVETRVSGASHFAPDALTKIEPVVAEILAPTGPAHFADDADVFIGPSHFADQDEAFLLQELASAQLVDEPVAIVAPLLLPSPAVEVELVAVEVPAVEAVAPVVPVPVAVVAEPVVVDKTAMPEVESVEVEQEIVEPNSTGEIQMVKGPRVDESEGHAFTDVAGEPSRVQRVVSGLTDDDERWLASLLDAFDALELDEALRGGPELVEQREQPSSVAEELREFNYEAPAVASAPVYEYEDLAEWSANPELGEWLDQPVLERLKPWYKRQHPVQLAQSGTNLFVALVLSCMTVAGVGGQPQNAGDDLASAVDRQGETAASRSGSFVSTPAPLKLAAAGSEVPPADSEGGVSTAPAEAPKEPAPAPAPPAAAQKQFSNPLPGAAITSGFGYRKSPTAGASSYHQGIDFSKPTGTAILVAADGVVTQAGWQSGYGNYTCVKHPDGFSTCYGHQSKIEVKVGQKVTRGQEIGKVGSTGVSTGPHLHFEVLTPAGVRVDPRKYL